MATRLWRLPVCAVSSLVLTAGIIALPVFSHAGVYYLDNPAHIAEVISLAQHPATGWSDIALCGFPLATLHSPLWYGALAWLAGLGIPAELPYLALLGLAFVAPSLALLYVLARRLPLWAALVLAYGLLAFRGAAIGSMAALGGMCTFYLACAALILLADRLARRERTWFDVAVIAGLTAFIGLSHTYVTIGLIVLGAVHAGFVLAEGLAGVRLLVRDGVGFALGAVASARYLLLVIASGASSYGGVENLAPSSVLRRLVAGFGVTPTATTALGRFLENRTLYTDSLVQVAIMLLGVAGVRHAFRIRREDRLAIVGLTLALVLLFVLVFVLPGTTLGLLGPQSFRLTYIAKLGLFFAAVPLVAAHARRPVSPRVFAVLCAACVASGFWWQRNVEGVMPAMSEVRELEQFWARVAADVQPSWGRVYVQDTFDTPGTGTLGWSHAMALTSARTGAKQHGAFYGVMPFATRVWTAAERGALFGVDPATPGALDRIADGMRATNSTHLMLVDPQLSRQIARDPRFRIVRAHGRYALLERSGATSQPTAASEGVQLIASHSEAPGRIELGYRAEAAGGRLQLSEAYSPLWRLDPPLGRIEETPDGLVALTNLQSGAHTLRLQFTLPRAPFWITVCGLLAIFALGLASLLRARSGSTALSEKRVTLSPEV